MTLYGQALVVVEKIRDTEAPFTEKRAAASAVFS